MADDGFVVAVHKTTGVIQTVPEPWLEIYPDLKPASDKVLKDAQKQAEEQGVVAPATSQEGA